MVISSLSPLTAPHFSPPLLLFHLNSTIQLPRHRPPLRSTPAYFSPDYLASGRKHSIIFSSIDQTTPRTLFPGGYKRPEIKVPTIVLRLSSDEVLRDDKAVLDVVDEAVSDRVGIVVLNAGDGSGKRLYDAACLLKSVIRDRAYFLIDERVDIAAAINASGVLVSDQGLPTIVARNTMMDAKSESVILPLVGRTVQTPDAALDASISEGADFIIYSSNGENGPEGLLSTVTELIKIPIFFLVDKLRDETSVSKCLDLLGSGVGGVVLSLDDLSFFSHTKPSKSIDTEYASYMKLEDENPIFDRVRTLDVDNGFPRKASGFTKLEEKEQYFIEKERSFLLEAIDVIQRATPLMGDISLLKDAVLQLDDPFLLVIVGEFNSGKSSVINALLGRRYLKDGVVPTTNEITFLRYSESDSSEQRCERYPDGQYICYMPAQILKEMIIVDTPGTNVILQRQQRLTEEFVPRADLILFVMSADRPLTESEVTFLRYVQQWRKKTVFVLNKSDLYLNEDELEEAIAFIKENTQRLLNVEHITLYPMSARNALERKLSASFSGPEDQEQFLNTPYRGANRFFDLESYLCSFLDGSTSNGMERMKLKLETPLKITEQVLSASQRFVAEEFQQAEQDLVLVKDLITSVKEYALKMENESISWKRQILSLIDSAQARALKLAESTLQLSNLDLVISYVLKDKSSQTSVTISLRDEIIDPAVSEAQKLLREYTMWLQSNNARKANMFKESFQKRWPSVSPYIQSELEASELLRAKHELGMRTIEDFSTSAASKLFEQEIREVLVGTVGGLGAAGLSASLLTSVLTTTLEDLLALGICSAGGLLVISNFPARRRRVIDKVRRTADALARQLEEAMEKDLVETTNSLNNFVTLIGKPYQDTAQDRVSKLSRTLDELRTIEEKLNLLQVEVQNLHVSR